MSLTSTSLVTLFDELSDVDILTKIERLDDLIDREQLYARCDEDQIKEWSDEITQLTREIQNRVATRRALANEEQLYFRLEDAA